MPRSPTHHCLVCHTWSNASSGAAWCDPHAPGPVLPQAFLPWSPLGGIGRTDAVGAGRLALQCIAEDRGVSVQQVILAWELALAPTVIPIPGASRAASIQDSVRAADLELTADEISKLSDANDRRPSIKEQS